MKAERMICPYKGCIGRLIHMGVESTTVGYTGLDRNTHREKFKCSACKKTVRRAWQWEGEEETLHDA